MEKLSLKNICDIEQIEKETFEQWEITITSYIQKILNISVKYIASNEVLQQLYSENKHPYTAAVIIILQSDEYFANKIYNSFIVVYENEIVFINIKK